MKPAQLRLVSVIIPHQGVDEPLKLCIEALRLQTYPTSRVEILIVINEPAKREPTFKLKSNEKILWQPDYYSYAARNKGIEASKGSIIALTDSDTIPDPWWITNGARSLEKGPDMVAGLVDLSFSRRPLTAPACYEKLFAFDQEKNVRFGRAATANLFLARLTFDTYGLFNRFSESGEDFSWTRRATQSGARLVFDREISVSHPAREKFSELFIKAKRVSASYESERRTMQRIRRALTHYISVYVTPPSRAKRKTASGKEMLLGYSTSAVVQAVKLWFFITSATLQKPLQQP